MNERNFIEKYSASLRREIYLTEITSHLPDSKNMTTMQRGSNGKKTHFQLAWRWECAQSLPRELVIISPELQTDFLLIQQTHSWESRGQIHEKHHGYKIFHHGTICNSKEGPYSKCLSMGYFFRSIMVHEISCSCKKRMKKESME